MAKFPKTIFCKQERDGSTEYLIAYESKVEAADLGNKVVVGVYQLIGREEISAAVVSKKMRG